MTAHDRIPVTRRRRRVTGSGTVLTDERIVTTALELIEAPGGSALNVRRLGQALGCDPSAVYRYFAGTDAILLAVADRLIEESVAGFTPSANWQASLREFGVRVHRSMLRHPRLAVLRASRLTTRPGELRAVDTGVGILLRAGFPAADAVRHYRAFIDTVLAHAAVDATVQERDARLRVEEERAWQAACDALSDDAYPHLHQVRGHLRLLTGSAFDDVLDVQLAHLARLRPSSR
ncbi:TetR/AcrR family transcriptional regulator [Streptomyces sp. NPDC003697]